MATKTLDQRLSKFSKRYKDSASHHFPLERTAIDLTSAQAAALAESIKDGYVRRSSYQRLLDSVNAFKMKCGEEPVTAHKAMPPVKGQSVWHCFPHEGEEKLFGIHGTVIDVDSDGAYVHWDGTDGLLDTKRRYAFDEISVKPLSPQDYPPGDANGCECRVGESVWLIDNDDVTQRLLITSLVNLYLVEVEAVHEKDAHMNGIYRADALAHAPAIGISAEGDIILESDRVWVEIPSDGLEIGYSGIAYANGDANRITIVSEGVRRTVNQLCVSKRQKTYDHDDNLLYKDAVVYPIDDKSLARSAKVVEIIDFDHVRLASHDAEHEGVKCPRAYTMTPKDSVSAIANEIREEADYIGSHYGSVGATMKKWAERLEALDERS